MDPDESVRNEYEALVSAFDAGVSAMKPGTHINEVREAIVEVLIAKGFKKLSSNN